MSAAERFLAGRVRVRATGARAENLLNAAFGREVRLHNVLRESSRQIAFDVDYGDFFAMRTALRDAGCKIHILRREGVPHIRARLRLRFMLAVGAVLCALAVMGLTQFVWGVSVVGELDIEQRALAQEILEGMGIHAGMLRGEVDRDAVEDAITEGIEDLTFVGVRMRGLTLQVQIVPSPEAPRMLGVGVPADIVADTAGTVERVMVLEGTAAVSPGQEVVPGDVLIRGVAVGPGGTVQVHAMGEVTVRVWVSGEGAAPLYSRETKATGRYINRRTVMLGGAALPEHPHVPFAEYIIAARETTCSVICMTSSILP